MLVQDLQTNKEILEERRKQLEAIHQTSAKIKDISDSMAKQLNEQGAILDDVEQNVETAKDNAVKAKEEITKADEMSRGNRKKMLCLILIIILAVGVISAILLSLML
jgi:t-SNARE complex subunit (syntaxin)